MRSENRDESNYRTPTPRKRRGSPSTAATAVPPTADEQEEVQNTIEKEKRCLVDWPQDGVDSRVDFGGPPSEASSSCYTITERDVQGAYPSKREGRFARLRAKAGGLGSERFFNSAWWLYQARRTFPLLQVLRTYDVLNFLPRDIGAGLLVGIASIPMGIAYGLLAGLPQSGLYNNLVYPLIYMMFGTALHISIGASAIEAKMAAKFVEQLVGSDPPEDVLLNAMVGLTLAVGIVLILMRILGLGVVANFLADPVLSGFSTGSALAIFCGQFKVFVGISVPSGNIIREVWYLARNLSQANLFTLGIGLASVLFLYIGNILNRRYFRGFPLPFSLLLLILTIGISRIFALNQAPYNVAMLLPLSRGLPRFMPFNFDYQLVLPLLQQSFWFAVIYVVNHISITKSIAQSQGYAIDVNQELFAVGICGVIGSFFRCFPVSTSVSRSTIAIAGGAATPLFNLFASATVLITLLFFVGQLRYLPAAVPAAIISLSIINAMQFREGVRLMKLATVDFLLWVTCFGITFGIDASLGVTVSVVLSIIWILKRSAFPRSAVLGRLPGSSAYRDVTLFPMAREVPGIKIVRFDAALNFANSVTFEKRIETLMWLNGCSNLGSSSRSKLKPSGSALVDKLEPQVVVVDASSITSLDISALRVLKDLSKRLKDQGKLMLFANWKGLAPAYVDVEDFYNIIPQEHCFLSLHEAVMWAELGFVQRSTASLPAGNHNVYSDVDDDDVDHDFEDDNNDFASNAEDCALVASMAPTPVGITTAAGRRSHNIGGRLKNQTEDFGRSDRVAGSTVKR